MRQSQAARRYEQPALTLVEGGLKPASTRALSVLVICILLGLMQVFDGALTFLGVNRFGVHLEGNPLIRVLIELYGVVPTVLLVKGFAIGTVALLYVLSPRVRWVPAALWGVSALYFFAAILPWSVILMG